MIFMAQVELARDFKRKRLRRCLSLFLFSSFVTFFFFSFLFFFLVTHFSFSIDSSENQKGTLVYKRVPAVRMLLVHRFDFVSSLLSDRSGSPTPYYVTNDARSSAFARVGGCTSPDFNFVLN